MSAKGRAIRDKSLSKLDNRMISAMLKNEKIAEKELEKKMKALKDLERKSMVKICETSLDVKYDLRRKRNTQAMEGQLSEDALNASLDAGRTLRMPSDSRRGSLVTTTVEQEELKEKESPGGSARNPAILINSGSKDDASIVTDALSPYTSPRSPTPTEEPPIDEEEAQKLLKVFSQSSRGSQRRRTAPEITDLSPKILIQMAKSSAEVKRRGSTYDAAAAINGDQQSTEPLYTRRRASATIEIVKAKSEQDNSGETASPTLRRRGSAAVANLSVDRLNSPIESSILRRRGASAANKNSLSLERNEALLREKISEQAPLSPRLKQPFSPLLGKVGSPVAATLRPVSAQPAKDLASEPMLPDLKRPQTPSLRRSLSPMRASSPLSRPVSPTRSTSSLSAESIQGEPQLEEFGAEYNLTRGRGSRPGSARSCHSIPAGRLSPCYPAARRGSELLSQIDLNALSPASPMRRAMEDPKATLNPSPASPNDYRRHSETVESLQGRVDEFLKTLTAKGS